MRGSRWLPVALLLSSGAATAAEPCPAVWEQRAASGPAARTANGMAYDAARAETVVFGGTGDIFGTSVFGDTWGWDGARWQLLSGSGPRARRDGLLAYDSVRARVVLFGGTDTELISGNRYFTETWEWDGTSWSTRATAGPPGRNAHALAYDAARGRVVLFGGGADHELRPNDVWEWDGTLWRRVDAAGPRPSARLSPLMAYDERRGRVVLHGGFSPPEGTLADTWEWDGARWARREVGGPSPADRNGAAMAYDAARGVMVLTGGADSTESALAGVWELDDSGWHARETGGPPPRIAPALAYDTARSRLVLFGGITRAAGAFGDTWEREAPRRIERLVPVIVDVRTATARFTTDLALTNRGERDLPVTYRYTASLGGGSGSVTAALPAGRQLVLPDAIAFLREHGLAIPAAEDGPQAGTLLVDFGCDAADGTVSVTARTASAVAAPEGRAGLAYPGLDGGTTGRLYVYGLRETAGDRSNLALLATSDEPVTLRVTLRSGAGDGGALLLRDAETLPARGWLQINRVLQSTGIESGWAEIERVGGGSFSAYGVVNDNVTNDGSYLAPVPEGRSGDRLTVPVLAEAPNLGSELVLANRGAEEAVLSLSYVRSLTAPAGSDGTATVTLAPGEQRIVPAALAFLRERGVNVGEPGATYVGSLRVRVAGGSVDHVFAAARTGFRSGGGSFGLFSPAVDAQGEAAEEAILSGLLADAENRTNVAVVHSGADGSGTLVLEIRAYDGEAGGAERGTPIRQTLEPGQHAQVNGILGAAGVRNGWVRVRRLSGSAPWIAYAVVNDGAAPGERTGDGAYVAMELTRRQ